MTKDYSTDPSITEFWLTHPDPTQAAVHMALQWIAFVYPASELQIDRTLKHALPYADADLSARWSQFLDENDADDHVEALNWVAKTLSAEQIPFLVETCWRLLLIDHELPTHVPLALRILGQILSISEADIHELGEAVYREYVEEDELHQRAPLLPIDPRYLDRIEWRLYGHSATQRLNVKPSTEKRKERNIASYYSFGVGMVCGAILTIALVFGPLQLGRIKIPIMLHDGLLVDNSGQVISTNPDDTQSDEVDALISEMSSLSTIQNSAPTEPLPSVSDVNAELPVVEPNVAEENIAQTPSEVASAPEPSAGAVAEAEQPTPIANPNPTSGGRVLMEVSASILNVRKEPVVESDVLIKLAAGAKVWAYPDQATGLWMLVKVEGVTGYASSRFLSTVEN